MAVSMGEAEGRITLDTSGFDRAMQSVINSINTLNSTAQGMAGTMNNINGTLSTMAGAANQPAEQMSALSRALETVRSGLAAFNNSSNDTVTRLRGLSDAAVTVGSSWTEHLSKPLFDVGKTCVEMATTFESQMDRVGAISGATSEELQQITAYAQEMGAKTMFSSQQCGEAMEYMAMAGWKVNDIIAGLPGVLNLAAIGETELARASDIVTDALTAFGEEANQAGRLADIMAATITSANTDVEMLGQTFKYVAPVAGAAGYSMEETATMIGLMGNAGIKASQAGTSLRATISRLTTQSGEAGEAMDDLGISVTKEDGNLLSLTDTMNLLRYKLRDLTEEEQVAYSKKLAGMTAFSGLLGIINATDEAYADLTGTTQVANFTTEENKEQVEALGFAMGAVMTDMGDVEAQFDGLGITMRDSNREFGNVIDFAGRLRTGWGELTTEQQKYFTELLTNEDTLEEFNTIMSMTDAEFDAFLKTMDEAGGLANVLADQMMDNLRGKLLLLQSATENAAIAFGTLLIPVIEKITEAFTAFVVWVNNLSEGQKTLVVVIGAVVAAIGPLLSIFGKLLAFGLDVHDNLGRLKDIFRETGTAAQTAANGGVSIFSTAMGKLKTAVLHPIQSIKSLGTAFMNLNAPIRVLMVVVAALAAAWATNFGNIRGVVTSFISEHKAAFGEIISLFANVIGALVSFVGAFAQKIKEWYQSSESVKQISALFESVLEVIATVLGAIIDVIGAAAKAINAVFDLFKGKDKKMETTGTEIAGAFADGFGKGMDIANDNAKTGGESIISSFKTFTGDAEEAGSEVGSSLATGVLKSSATGLEALGITAKEAVEGAKEPTKQAAVGLAKAVEEGINLGMAGVSNILSTETADEMVAAFQKAGVEVTIAGQEMMNSATGEIIAVWNKEIGGWAMTDVGLIASGLQDQVPYVTSSIDEIANAIGAGGPKLKQVGNNLMVEATGEIIAKWNEGMNQWEITAPERIVNGLLVAEEQSRQAAALLAQYTIEGYTNSWDLNKAQMDGKLEDVIAAIKLLYPEAEAAGSGLGLSAVEAYEDELNKFSTNNSIRTSMLEPFKAIGLEVKAEAGKIMNVATGEILVEWDKGIQKFKLTEAGKLALALAEQKDAMLKAAIDNIKAANDGVVTQWDILVAAAKGELFPQVPQALEEQTPASTEAGKSNIAGYGTGAQGQWQGSVYPWVQSLGPMVGTALAKGSQPANSAGSKTMNSFFAGLKSGWAQIAAWVNQQIAWIAAKLAVSVSGFGAPRGGGASGASLVSGAQAVMARTARAMAYSIQEPMMMALDTASTNAGIMALDAATYAGETMAVYSRASNKASDKAAQDNIKMSEVLTTFFELLTKFFDQIEKEIKEFNEHTEKEQQAQIDKMVKPVTLMFKALEEVYTNGFRKLNDIMTKGFNWEIINDTADKTSIKFVDIMNKFAQVFAGLDGILQSTIGAIDETWSKGWSYITDDFIKNIEAIDKAWSDGLKKLAEDTNKGLDDLKKATGMSLQEIQMLNYNYGTQVGNTWSNITEVIKGLKEAAGDKSLLEAIKTIGDKVLKMKGSWLDACDAMDLWVEKSVDMTEFANNLAEEIEKPTEKTEKISKSWKEMGDSAEKLSDSLGTLRDKLFATELVLGEIMRQFKEFDGTTDISADATKELTKAFKKQFDKIKDSVDELIKVFGESETKIGDASTALFEQFVKAFKKVWWDMLAWFRKPEPDENLAQLVKDVQNWHQRMRDAGRMFMSEFTEGMRTMWNTSTRPMFEGWITYMVDRLERMRSMLAQMKAVQEEAARVAAAMRAEQEAAAAIDGSHANGLNYVPYDGYIAELHAGERVLTKKEAQEYRNEKTTKAGGDTFIFNSPKAIDAREAARLMKQTKRNILGGFI